MVKPECPGAHPPRASGQHKKDNARRSRPPPPACQHTITPVTSSLQVYRTYIRLEDTVVASVPVPDSRNVHARIAPPCHWLLH